ncbi:hypothetical protein SKAU_G00351670 [Synaphobranchus kaupii]|uniref:Fibroblast growth factor n=1 Tax=Synaphobranchus kaupii TaxID=118154 RepID=A0A9Q1EKH5_SYNKA|nr:hypothetical protein SKAU_G00351670 [Synaphobranchus kaupii]
MKVSADRDKPADYNLPSWCNTTLVSYPIPGCGARYGKGNVHENPGPHIANRWDESVRLRHLYAGKYGLHLQINGDGKVDGSVPQSSYSLLEIRPVDTGYVAIKGVTTAQYLCMEERGRLYGSHAYVKDDCSFVERVLPNGYNVYASDKYSTVVSLSSGRQRFRAPAQSLPPLSQFLPMVSAIAAGPMGGGDLRPPAPTRQEALWTLDVDSTDPLGIMSQTGVQSPSFGQR